MALIEREALLDIAEQQGHVTVDDILSADTIDAAPVVHGRWINREGPDEDMNVTDQCSKCWHRDTHSPTVDVPYCWFCGARMNGGEDDG